MTDDICRSARFENILHKSMVPQSWNYEDVCLEIEGEMDENLYKFLGF